jgi:dGTP triphosphohydrolase
LHADAALAGDADYRFAHVIDYVSGMTDSYALKTYADLFGMAPSM